MGESFGISLWLEPSPSSVICGSLQSTITSLKFLFDDASTFHPHITITSQIDIDPNSKEQINAVLNAAKVAATSVDRIDVVLSRLVYGSQFFKKVYLQVEPSLELMSLAHISREEFVILPKLLRNKKRTSSSSSLTTSVTKRKSTSSTGSNNSGSTAVASPKPSSSDTPQPLSKKDNIPTPSSDYEATVAEASKEASLWVKHEFDPHLSLVYSNTYPIEEATKTSIDSRLQDVFGGQYMDKKFGFRGARLSLVYCEGPVEDWKVLGYRDF